MITYRVVLTFEAPFVDKVHRMPYGPSTPDRFEAVTTLVEAFRINSDAPFLTSIAIEVTEENDRPDVRHCGHDSCAQRRTCLYIGEGS